MIFVLEGSAQGQEIAGSQGQLQVIHVVKKPTHDVYMQGHLKSSPSKLSAEKDNLFEGLSVL